MSDATSSVKPSEYKKRYENLQVNFADGTMTHVNIERYRNAAIQRFFNPAGRDAFLRKLATTGINTDLIVNTPTLQVTVTQKEAKEGKGLPNWNELARYVFKGKGSPEACQIVIQLARFWELAPNIPDYVETYLGLDCNGFVGNYLWHTWGDAKDWKDLGVIEKQPGPDCGISGYLEGRHRKSILDWNNIDPSESYILGKVGRNSKIIDAMDGDDMGHIAITDPGERDDITLRDGSKTFAIKTVESTASNNPKPGLGLHWYKLRDPSKHKPENGVFEIDRGTAIDGGDDHRYVKFKIVERDATIVDKK